MTDQHIIYMDNAATTAVRKEVLDAMLPYFTEHYGNPSSIHSVGRDAKRAVEAARKQVAAALNAQPQEIYFTAGGSESDNWALRSATEMLAKKGKHIITSSIEHHAVLHTCEYLEKQHGYRITYLPVDEFGRVSPDDVKKAIAEDTVLISIMAANNEIGTLQHIAEIGKIAKEAGVLFHTDAVQALGKIEIDFRGLGVHALTLSAHKIGGPLGAGALVVDKRVELAPLIAGGGQERGLRSGTENVAAIVGFGAACELAVARREAEHARLTTLRDEIEAALAARGAQIFSAGALRLPNTVFFALAGIDGETLVGKLDRAGFACASGSACSSANPEPSHTLLAMGVEPGLARGALRVSLGRDTCEDDVRRFVQTFVRVADELKNLASVAR